MLPDGITEKVSLTESRVSFHVTGGINTSAEYAAGKFSLLETVDPTLETTLCLVRSRHGVIGSSSYEIDVSEAIVSSIERIAPVEESLKLSAHLVIVYRRSKTERICLTYHLHQFGHIVLDCTGQSRLTCETSLAETDILILEAYHLHIVTGIKSAFYELLSKRFRIAPRA